MCSPRSLEFDSYSQLMGVFGPVVLPRALQKAQLKWDGFNLNRTTPAGEARPKVRKA